MASVRPEPYKVGCVRCKADDCKLLTYIAFSHKLLLAFLLGKFLDILSHKKQRKKLTWSAH